MQKLSHVVPCWRASQCPLPQVAIYFPIHAKNRFFSFLANSCEWFSGYSIVTINPKNCKQIRLTEKTIWLLYKRWQYFTSRPKKKNSLFLPEHPGEIFFPIIQLLNFFWNKSIKKILNRKRKLKKRKKNEISWKKMLVHSSSLTFFICIYKPQIRMFQLM